MNPAPIIQNSPLSFLEQAPPQALREHYEKIWEVLPDVLKNHQQHSDLLKVNILTAVFSNLETNTLAPFPSFGTLYQCLLLATYHRFYQNLINMDLMHGHALLIVILDKLAIEPQKSFVQCLQSLYHHILYSDLIRKRFTQALLNHPVCAEKIYAATDFNRKMVLLTPYASKSLLAYRLEQLLNNPSIKTHTTFLVELLESGSQALLGTLCYALFNNPDLITSFCSNSKDFLQVINILIDHKQILTAQQVLRFLLHPQCTRLNKLISDHKILQKRIEQVIIWYRLIKTSFPFFLNDFYDHCAQDILLNSFISDPQKSLRHIALHMEPWHQAALATLLIKQYGPMTPCCDLLFHSRSFEAIPLLRSLIYGPNNALNGDLQIHDLIAYTSDCDQKYSAHEWYASSKQEYNEKNQEVIKQLCRGVDDAILWASHVPCGYRKFWLLWVIKHYGADIMADSITASSKENLKTMLHSLDDVQLYSMINIEPSAVVIAVLLGFSVRDVEKILVALDRAQKHQLECSLCQSFPLVMQHFSRIDKNWLWYFLCEHIDKIEPVLKKQRLEPPCLEYLRQLTQFQLLKILTIPHKACLIITLLELGVTDVQNLAFLTSQLSPSDYKCLFEGVLERFPAQQSFLILTNLHRGLNNATLFSLVRNAKVGLTQSYYILLIRIIFEINPEFFTTSKNFTTVFYKKNIILAAEKDPVLNKYLQEKYEQHDKTAKDLLQQAETVTPSELTAQQPLYSSQESNDFNEIIELLLSDQEPVFEQTMSPPMVFSELGKRKRQDDQSNEESPERQNAIK